MGICESTPSSSQQRQKAITTAQHHFEMPATSCDRFYEEDRDPVNPNRNLTPLTTQVDAQGRMVVGGCALNDLAKQFGTPLYVVCEDTLRQSCRAYKKSFEAYKGVAQPIYASKANSTLALSKIVAQEGFGSDAVTEGELLTALLGGINPELVFLHGNNKSESEIKMALENKCTIVIDNHHDLELVEKLVAGGSPASLMLRFSPGIECHTHEYIKTGHLDCKFGFLHEDLKPVF